MLIRGRGAGGRGVIFGEGWGRLCRSEGRIGGVSAEGGKEVGVGGVLTDPFFGANGYSSLPGQRSRPARAFA